MRRISLAGLVMGSFVLFLAGCSGARTTAASSVPLDKNAGQRVIFQDDFEKDLQFTDDINTPGWHKHWRSEHVAVEEGAGKTHQGARCLRIHLPNAGEREEGGCYTITLPPPYADTVIVSYWIKYADDFKQGGEGYMHNGEVLINPKDGPADKGFVEAGFIADGTNFVKLSAEAYTSWRPATPPGHVVVMWRMANLQYDWFHTGKVPTRGQWHHVVLRVGLNTPREDNGYMNVWYDDELLGHFYGQHAGLTGFRMRTTSDMVIRSFCPTSYVHINSQDNTLWYDDIKIVAESPDLCQAPTGLKAEHFGKGMTLRWDESDGDAHGFNIYRSDCRQQAASTPFVRLNDQPVNGLSYVDKTARDHGAYTYMITAVNEKGESGFSLEACVK